MQAIMVTCNMKRRRQLFFVPFPRNCEEACCTSPKRGYQRISEWEMFDWSFPEYQQRFSFIASGLKGIQKEVCQSKLQSSSNLCHMPFFEVRSFCHCAQNYGILADKEIVQMICTGDSAKMIFLIMMVVCTSILTWQYASRCLCC
ncbi:hypothetical protein OUZ56_015267 [Daphnia magna]|uniref:Uncharacterized protein n=1 Tax=Daphnia magna TaxID=35525 RepID=A0ABR0AMB3_9CRUS|nr:hypothetical protein OUZ56_015267 [Daphnia magna]